MTYTELDRTLALAGVFQSCQLVQQVATTGHCDAAALETAMNSVFNTDPKNPEAVFGNALCLVPGLKSMVAQLSNTAAERNPQLVRYVLGVLHLERKLSRHPELIKKIGDGLHAAERQRAHFAPTHENVLAQLADIYSTTLSTFQPRIMVHGDPLLLNNPVMANKIRACLLSAIRSSVLWSQCGGSRWRLLFSRGKLIAQAKLTLANVCR